jgi:hypothetical protein
VYADDTAAIEPMSSHTGATGTPPEANAVLAAFGRLWAGDIDTDESTIYWSDTLLGAKWSGGTAGSIDLTTVWPKGYDRIIGLTAHNDFLVIFGLQSIIIYQGAEDPSTMTVYDVIENIGCLNRDTIQNIGSDVLFLAADGVRGLGRTIQDGSAPLSDFSKNIRNDVLFYISSQTTAIKSVYSPEESFYLLSFSDNNIVFCFDVRGTLDNGSFRATSWTGVKYKALHRTRTGTLYIGNVDGLSTYSGYLDDTSTYILKYYTHPLNFGDPARIKILKAITTTFIGAGVIAGTLRWSYNYGSSYAYAVFSVTNGSIAEYGTAEYGIAEYTTGVSFNVARTNTTGSGDNATIGIEVTINDALISIQQMDIKAVIGRGT